MADPKKPDFKKDAKPAPKDDPFVEIVTWIFLAMLAVYLLNGFANMFASGGLFSHGWQGLTPRGIMQNHTEPISSLQNPIGARVVSMSDETAVYDSPGGKQIGSQKFNSRGKILQGYVEIKGQKYWYVDFDSGADGWVKESDMAHLVSEPSLFEKILLWGWTAVPVFKLVSVLVSLGLILLTAYIVVKLTEIRKNERAKLYPMSAESAEVAPVNPKWEKILIQIESQNENDWKLAIVEADIMLSDILDKLHLPGETMGDKMKAVEKSDFTTIDQAWEAHKIRNQIAHEGSDFVLTQREARRVISLYQAIFEEFQII